jgi:hypothetical protein
MYATQAIYVMVLLPPSRSTHTMTHLGTHHSDPYQLQLLTQFRERQSWSLELARTSRVGMGSSRLLSHLTEMFIAEKKNCEATTSNNPAFLLMNADTGWFDRGTCVRCVGKRGDVSSVSTWPSLLEMNAGSGEGSSPDVAVV